MTSTTLTVRHPTSWAAENNGLQSFTITYSVRRVASFPGRYNVEVDGQRVGWVTKDSRGWSAAQSPADGEFEGKVVTHSNPTRAEAIEELLFHLRHVHGPVQDFIVANWQPAGSDQ